MIVITFSIVKTDPTEKWVDQFPGPVPLLQA